MKYLVLLMLMSCASGTNEQLKTIFVADHLADCTGVGKQQCMLIRENEQDEWTLFYQQIEGFQYEPGYVYQLEVAVTDVENPPADASGLKYTLKELISKTPSAQSDDFAGSWKIMQIDGLENIQIHPTLEFIAEENRIGGFAGCNNYFASYEVNGNEMTFGQSGATRMMCPDMTVEDAFLPLLSQVSTYKVEQKELHLFDNSGKLLILAVHND